MLKNKKNRQAKFYTLCGSGRASKPRGAREEKTQYAIPKPITYSLPADKEQCHLRRMQWQTSAESRTRERRHWNTGAVSTMDKYFEGFVPMPAYAVQRLYSAGWTKTSWCDYWRGTYDSSMYKTASGTNTTPEDVFSTVGVHYATGRKKPDKQIHAAMENADGRGHQDIVRHAPGL